MTALLTYFTSTDAPLFPHLLTFLQEDTQKLQYSGD